MKLIWLIIYTMAFVNVYLVNFVKLDDDYICSHNPEKQEDIVTGIHIDDVESGSRRKRATPTEFRIFYHYLPNFQNDPQFTKLRDEIMIPARDLLIKAIKPKIPLTGLLRVDRQCTNNLIRGKNGKKACATGCTATTQCVGITVPDVFLNKCKVMDTSGTITESGTAGAGIMDQDLVILVERTDCKSGVLAWASSCFLEEQLDRPVLGVINVCSTGTNVKVNNEKNIKTIAHELIHVLGFSVSFYAFYRDRNGNPLVPRNQLGLPSLGVSSGGYYNFNSRVAKPVERQRSSKVETYSRQGYAFTLPTVVTEAQHHFQCASLDSVDLEDAGGTGSAASHFDEYAFHDEIMSPVIYKVEFLSRLTLALLYDTGWYDVNGCRAETLKYGSGAGCTFALKGCFSYMVEQSSNKQPMTPFCQKIFQYGQNVVSCAENPMNFEYCNLRRHTSLDQKYQYFTDNNLGGNTVWMEYCPVILQNSCANDKAFPMAGPTFIGEGSRCYNNEIDKNNPSKLLGATCFKTICASNSYSFIIGSETFTCPASGSITYQGSKVECKPYSIVCPKDEAKSCPNWELGPPPPLKNQGNFTTTTQVNMFLTLVSLILFLMAD